MADRYLDLVNSGIGARVASTLGLPRPAVLRRYRVGEPLAAGPVLVGTTRPRPRALEKMLAAAGVEVATATDDAVRYGALVMDARTIGPRAHLRAVPDFLGSYVRSLLPSGRVIVLARSADTGDPV